MSLGSRNLWAQGIPLLGIPTRTSGRALALSHSATFCRTQLPLPVNPLAAVLDLVNPRRMFGFHHDCARDTQPMRPRSAACSSAAARHAAPPRARAARGDGAARVEEAALRERGRSCRRGPRASRPTSPPGAATSRSAAAAAAAATAAAATAAASSPRRPPPSTGGRAARERKVGGAKPPQRVGPSALQQELHAVRRSTISLVGRDAQ